MKIIESPSNDLCLCIWTMLFKEQHGRRPKVSELTHEGQIALGKKVFEFCDYRDKHRPTISDEFLYCGCLEDHGVERDRPDGIDVAIMLKKYPHYGDVSDMIHAMQG